METNVIGRQNLAYHRQMEIEASRARKVERLFDALVASCHGTVPAAATIAALDDAGWKALEALACTRKASAETRAALVARVERAHATKTRVQAEVDPFQGFPKAV